MPTLYVTEPQARIEKEYERILVTKEDEVLMRIPIQNVDAVALVGPVGATTQALHALLARQVPLFLVKYNGELIGRLTPAQGYNLPLRQEQYRRNDDADFVLKLARQIVAGKIRNQLTLAGRIARRKKENETLRTCVAQMKEAEGKARLCESMESLLGIEGSAARLHFDMLGEAFDAKWKFEKRTRRPPRDPVNALLSLGYTFLGYAMMTALEIVGLDPYLGYFHSEAYGRPALALDLIEEFRAPLVDSLTLGLLNRRLLREQDFGEDEAGGVRLSPRGLRVFFREFSDKLESRVTLRRIGRPLSYRKLMEVQARRLANVLLGKEEAYQPFEAR
jgi:CRISPR-associated protein Cas1